MRYWENLFFRVMKLVENTGFFYFMVCDMGCIVINAMPGASSDAGSDGNHGWAWHFNNFAQGCIRCIEVVYVV